ncbi:hypothetical protein FZC78_19590 [Rossellomorea vietnamensis]|uniref:Uncharacterized protein n=1 Tax=Rossellomorea vietnamensis TaxID=218284 RepID=A0A5D4NKI2_9BACI|nr:hypothetical protein [Rossellomorea vietnamensis]TYS14058.1 hypothetical protein FZC78_19590 [Rossellomorea vietnamensis]
MFFPERLLEKAYGKIRDELFKELLKGRYILFFLYAILFLVTGYFFILSFIKAVNDEGSPHLAAILFIIWASLSVIVTAILVNM